MTTNITTERGAHSGDLYVHSNGERIGVVYPSGPDYVALHEYGSSVLPHTSKHATEGEAVSALATGQRGQS
jgi:hypothetical protein